MNASAERTIVYYDFTKCDLSLIERLYSKIPENSKKIYLGRAMCNWLFWARENGAFPSDDEFIEVMEVYFPAPERFQMMGGVFQ